MPALPPVAGVARLILRGTTQGQPWAAVQYAQTGSTALTDAEANTLAAGVSNAWLNAMAQAHCTTVSLTEVETQDLSSVEGAIGLSGLTHAGTRSGTQAPNNVAAVASWKVRARYRGGHPRTYWPAGAAADIINGRLWGTTFAQLMETSIAAYVTNINAITLSGRLASFCAVSFYQGRDSVTHKPIPRTDPVVLPVVGSTFHGRVDTMRRRLGKETG